MSLVVQIIYKKMLSKKYRPSLSEIVLLDMFMRKYNGERNE